jgi:Aspartyl protease
MKYYYTAPDSTSKRRVPLLKVTLIHQDKKINILAMIDSGADICVFNLGYASALGLDLEKCEQVTVSGVEGIARDCYKTLLELEPEGLPKITVPVLFIDSSGVDGLLGQEGFFDQYVITFDRANDSFEIIPTSLV